MSWIIVGSLWPITEPSSTELTAYEVFFMVQWRLLYNTELLLISKLIYYKQLGFQILVLSRKVKNSWLLLALPLEGLLLQRAGTLGTSAAGFSLSALHSTRGSKTTDHTSLRDLKQMENKYITQNLMSRPTAPPHFPLLWGTALQSGFLTLKIHSFTCKRCLWVHLSWKLLQGSYDTHHQVRL